MKNSFYLSALLILSLAVFNSVNAQGLVSHDFNDGDMGPFVDCTTQNPNYAKVVNNRLRTYWQESSFNSSNRMTKGAEACADPVHNGIGYLTWKHCWMGFTMNIDEAYMGPSYTGVGSLAQIFGFNDAAGQFSWSALLEIENGDLTWIDRRGIGASRAEVVVYENFPKGVDMDIILHVVLSDNGTGLAEVFVNGELKYSAYNIRIGMGEFDSNDVQTNQSYTEFKIGQYNHTSAADNEIRIVDYDNISWYDGEDGYDIVNPDSGSQPIDDCIDFDAFTQIEAEDYCDESGTQITSSGNVGYIENGEWIMFEDIDFENGVASISASVSSGSSGGNIEIRQGSTTGNLLGTLEVSNTGSWTTWETISTNISSVSGVQDIYLVFTGGSGYLLDIDWFRFTEPVFVDFTPDPNKTYYIDAPYHNLRLAATGESEDAYTTSTTTTGADVEWKFVDKGNGYWHIQRAAGGTKPRLRTNQQEDADMQPTTSSGSWTYYDFTQGAITNTYFLTLPAVNTEFKRLQIDNTGTVKMVGDDRVGTWESFSITEATSSITNNTITIQENETGFCSVDGTIDNNHSSYTGTGFANTANALGNSIDWEIDGAAGSYTFTWRYASTSNRPADLLINGTIISSDIEFNSTGAWSSWQTTQSVTVSLADGAKTVRLQSTTSSGLGNIDYIEITGPEVTG
uniref:carbohydrate-binding protein n=1 Tax=Aquimarina pacifica TaxID=1296415 RepID=UPI000555317C